MVVGTYVAMLTVMLLALANGAPRSGQAPAAQARSATFAAAGGLAMRTLLHTYYSGVGSWRACDAAGCAIGDADWGDDSLTAIVAMREARTHDPRWLGVLAALAHKARTYPAPCRQAANCTMLSDEPEWDAVALAQEYLATRDPATLAKAKAAYNFVAQSHVYSQGACPRSRTRRPAADPPRPRRSKVR